MAPPRALPDVQAAIREVLAGDAAAWQRFFARFAPLVDKIVRASPAMGSYARCDDDCRNVMARVFERLRRDDFRALRLYADWQARRADKGFDDWIAVVTVNLVRDYMSEKLGVPDERGHSVKQLVNTGAGALPADGDLFQALPHATTREAARQLVEFAQAHLPADQLAALAGWLEGRDFAELARELGLADARAADKLVRAALARLRRHFGDDG